MLDPTPDPAPDPTPDPQDSLESLPAMTLDEWLDKLRRADRAFYNIMAMEVWSIAKTMDGIIPGFWSRFMTNRRIAMKQFIEKSRIQHPGSASAINEVKEQADSDR
ncbi:hypothetical protein ACKFKG_13870 [Phormidesmis sp. 146-35]